MNLESLLKRDDLPPEVKAIIQEEISENRKLKLERDELKVRRGYFKNIFEKSPIGIELYNENALLVNANEACLNLFGVSDINDVKGFNLLEDPNIPKSMKQKLLNRESVRYRSVFDFSKVQEYQLYNQVNLEKYI